MKLGIGSYTYGWAVAAGELSALDLIERAQALGVVVVQLCDNLPAETYEQASLDRIASAVRAAGVGLEVGTRGSRPDHLTRYIDVARRLGSGVLRLVIDDGADRPEPDEVVARLKRVAPDFGRAGVTLAVENHDRFRAKELAEIIRRVASERVGICLDTVNSIGALEGPEVVVETLGPYVSCLHLKDFAVTRFPHLQGFTVEGRPLGQGMLDVPWLLSRLKAFGREFNAVIEQWVPPEATTDETIRKERRWAEEGVRAARQWIKE
jgi:sugar phosphate isomerase/epimerase